MEEELESPIKVLFRVGGLYTDFTADSAGQFGQEQYHGHQRHRVLPQRRRGGEGEGGAGPEEETEADMATRQHRTSSFQVPAGSCIWKAAN